MYVFALFSTVDFMSAFLGVCIWLHVFVCDCNCVESLMLCLGMCSYVLACVRIRWYVFAFVRMCVWLYMVCIVCKGSHVLVFVCACVSVFVCVCSWLFVILCAWLYAFVYVGVCLRVLVICLQTYNVCTWWLLCVRVCGCL